MSSANGGSSSNSGGMVMPPKNEALKKEEEAEMHGADLTVWFDMPDGTKQSLECKMATEVGYVKLLLAQKINFSHKDVKRLTLLHDGKTMIDPMSLCDHSGVTAPETVIEVQIRE